jgi:hypothetical protein
VEEHQAEETQAVNTLNAEAFANLLIDLIELDDHRWSDDGDKPRVRSFAEAGVLTTDAGLVLRAPDGQEFQITVVRSR